MTTDLTEVYNEFRLIVGGYAPLTPLSEEDYFIIFKRGIRRMYIDTGRASLYVPSNFTEETLDACPVDMGVDEQYYALLAAQIAFWQQMGKDMASPNRMTKHQTDALSVTFSDKSADNLYATLHDLEADLREAYFKMPQFVGAIGR